MPKQRKRKNIVQEVSDNEIEDSDADEQNDSEEENKLDEGNTDEELLEEELEDDDDDENSDDNDSEEDDFKSHKKSLSKLKDIDPEFYQFLQENDKKLLNFNVEGESDDEEQEDELHKPEGEIEVASDESDFEDDNKRLDERAITLKMLKAWRNDIQTDKSNKTIVTLIRAFNAAVCTVSGVDDDESESFYKVEGSAVFNAVIQICVLELGPALRRYLRIENSKQPPHKSRKFVKIKATLRGYFADLLKILNGVTSSNILTVLLKHLHYMAPMIISYGNITKPMLKKLTDLWSSGDESVRVVAFLCILRITTNQQQSLLDSVLKMMHLAYVKNSKFVSVNSLPGINFMRRSLVEMFSLDLSVSYQHVFLYVRQLAIHLRNAITVKKKENIQAVYNWQFINSLKLWGNLLSVTYGKPQLKPLVYPFVQVCSGTIKLVPTTQFYPLRFHVAQTLTDLSGSTGVFVPILPFVLEPLTYDFGKKHQKVSLKPLSFTCLLRLSKSQLTENGFKDALIDAVYSHVLEYLSSKSNSLAFPDLSLHAIVQLKQFLKTCHVASYTRKMKQLLEKVEQNAKFIQNERKNVKFDLKDFKQVDAWEATVKANGTPLSTFYESWNKLRNIKRNKEVTRNDEIGDYNLPSIRKSKKVVEGVRKDANGKVELFPSDTESEAEDVAVEERKEEEKSKKRKRGKRGDKNSKKRMREVEVEVSDGDDLEDIVEDLKDF